MAKYDRLPDSFSPEIHEIIEECFMLDPKKRPSVYKLLKNNFFKKHGLELLINAE
jgi:serine/threonine protein kinase